jgi:hypothetical protein
MCPAPACPAFALVSSNSVGPQKLTYRLNFDSLWCFLLHNTPAVAAPSSTTAATAAKALRARAHPAD